MMEHEVTPQGTDARSSSGIPQRTVGSGRNGPELAVCQLQRTVGNRAVLEAIGRPSPALQRDAEQSPPPGARTALTRAEDIRAAATVRLGKIGVYNERSDQAIASYREMRTRFAARWGAAWERHSSKLAEGNAQGATENFVEGIVVGTVTAVLVTAAGAVFFPAAAGAAAFTAPWWAFNIGTNATSSIAGSFLTGAVGRPSVPGPVGGRRDAEADGWRRIAEVERTARAVAALGPRFGLELGNAEYCISQVRSHLDRSTGDMNWEQTLDMVSTLASWENSLVQFDSEIDGKLETMTEFDRQVEAFKVPSVNVLEKEIWRAWMSTLDESTDEVLDQDAIQEYLVKLGLIPDHWYMTDEDQHRAVAAARVPRQSSEP